MSFIEKAIKEVDRKMGTEGFKRERHRKKYGEEAPEERGKKIEEKRGKFDRERFEDDLIEALSSEDKLFSTYKYWADEIGKLPSLPMDVSAFAAEARIRLETLAEESKKHLDWLRKILEEIWRLEVE